MGENVLEPIQQLDSQIQDMELDIERREASITQIRRERSKLVAQRTKLRKLQGLI